MRQDPLVSVVMGSFEPCWSRLRRAVDSLVGQTLPEWELLLWDDGSSPQGALALEQAARLEEEAAKSLGAPADMTYSIGGVIAINAGPNLIGLVYREE